MHTITDHEFRHSVAGGASQINNGEFGASEEEMRAFWKARGHSDEVVDRIAQRAATVGGVFGDPETLEARLAALTGMLVVVPEERILQTCADTLAYRPETTRRKLDVLSQILPKVDVLQMIYLRPKLLIRSANFLTTRCTSILGLLPRGDMVNLIGSRPDLLLVSPPELQKRAAIILKLYSRMTIIRWEREHATNMLMTPSDKLSRLELVDSLTSKLRSSVPDRVFLTMSDKVFHRRFVANRKSHWRKPGQKPREEKGFISKANPLALQEGENIPKNVNLLQWGAERAQALHEAGGNDDKQMTDRKPR